MDFNEWLTAKGFDPSTLSDTQRAPLEAQWRAEGNATDGDDPAPVPPPKPAAAGEELSFDARMTKLRKEAERVDEIERIAINYMGMSAKKANIDACNDIRQKAIEKGLTAREAELQFLLATRSGGPAIHIPSEPETNGKVLEAAVCVAGGLDNIDKHFDERTLSAANKHFRGGIGLNDLMMISAKRNGYRSISNSVKGSIQSVLRHAFSNTGSEDGHNFTAGPAGPSTYTLPQILSNVANKFLRVGFEAVDSTWRSISAIRSVNDFKQITTATLTGALQYTAVPRGGEIKHGTIGETYYNNQANTYGQLIGIDRRDIINDDLGALTTVGRRMGRGGALGLNDVFWTVFLNNTGSFFTAGNNNVSTGGGSALATADGAAINAAEVKFMNQTDPDGKPIAVQPKIMLVPPTLRNTAARWMGSQLFIGSTGLGDSNIYGGRYTVVSSPYMENSSYTGNGTAYWYLLADPQDMPVIEVVFLNGMQTPTVETSDLDWNTLGISMRGYFDYGAALQEYRGGVRSAGS